MFDEKSTLEKLQSYVALQKSTKKKRRHKYFLKLVEEEMADVLFYLLALANAFNVDLEQAFTRKQQYNNEIK